MPSHGKLPGSMSPEAFEAAIARTDMADWTIDRLRRVLVRGESVTAVALDHHCCPATIYLAIKRLERRTQREAPHGQPQ